MLNLIKELLQFESETKAQAKQSYAKTESISQHLPWVEGKAGCIYLRDGKSVGAVFNVEDVPAEARSADYLEALRASLQGLFQDVFTPYFDNECPWVMQLYLYDELNLDEFYQSCENYVKPLAKGTQLTQSVLSLLKEHLAYMTRAEGLFTDTKVSGNVFRGLRRCIKLVIYRKLTQNGKIRRSWTPTQDLNATADTLMAKLQGMGIKIKRCSVNDFYQWMQAWFNPSSTLCNYPDEDKFPFGFDFSEQLFLSAPESDAKQGIWYFDKQPHKYIPILGLRELPETGHLSCERDYFNQQYALFDKFPLGSVFVLTVIMQSQEQVKNLISEREKRAERSSTMDGQMALEDYQNCKRMIESGNWLFPTTMGVYLKANTLEELQDKEIELHTLLNNNKFLQIAEDYHLTPVNSYLRFLPFCYDFDYDKKWLSFSRYLSGVQLSKLLPLYGRERATGHPLLAFYNRGGEPLTIDPLNTLDKSFNSHLLLLGTTGSGKSATCIYLMLLLMAFYRPRLVVVDAGNSLLTAME